MEWIVARFCLCSIVFFCFVVVVLFFYVRVFVCLCLRACVCVWCYDIQGYQREPPSYLSRKPHHGSGTLTLSWWVGACQYVFMIDCVSMEDSLWRLPYKHGLHHGSSLLSSDKLPLSLPPSLPPCLPPCLFLSCTCFALHLLCGLFVVSYEWYASFSVIQLPLLGSIVHLSHCLYDIYPCKPDPLVIKWSTRRWEPSAYVQQITSIN